MRTNYFIVVFMLLMLIPLMFTLNNKKSNGYIIVTTTTYPQKTGIYRTVQTDTVIDINKSTIQDFTNIGMYPPIAENIVEYREKNGYYKQISDLLYVGGIGEEFMKEYTKNFTISPNN